MTIRRFLPVTFLVVASILPALATARADVYDEIMDAGETPTTASPTFTANTTPAPLTAITGSLDTASDADLYVIDITDPANFSASTANTLTEVNGLDTQLFLFDLQGDAIYTNDDASGLVTQSQLPGGLGLSQAGLYLLGISLTGNDPIDATGQLVFDLGSVSTGVYAGNPSAGAESTFDDLQTDTEGGLYEITLTGVSVPEPTTSAALWISAGLICLAGCRRRIFRA